MGLTVVQEDIEHLLKPKREELCIQVLVLTETKLVPKQHNALWLKNLFQDHDVHYSSKAPAAKAHDCQRQGSAGVIIVCKKDQEFGKFQRFQDIPLLLSGHIVVLENDYAKITLIGVYMPCDNPQMRVQLYNFLATTINKAHDLKRTVIVAGDWNAVWHKTDRSSGVVLNADKQHQRAMAEMGMCPVQTQDRAMTYGIMSLGEREPHRRHLCEQRIWAERGMP